jgi:hypothetical protein
MRFPDVRIRLRPGVVCIVIRLSLHPAITPRKAALRLLRSEGAIEMAANLSTQTLLEETLTKLAGNMLQSTLAFAQAVIVATAFRFNPIEFCSRIVKSKVGPKMGPMIGVTKTIFIIQ